MTHYETRESAEALWWTFAADVSLSGPGELEVFTNHFDRTLFVIRSIDVCNTGGASGSGFQLIDGNGVTFHQAQRGAGTFDTFPWRGYRVVPFNETITVNADDTSSWDVSLSGFYVPDYFQDSI